MVYYALNICPEDSLSDIESLCRGAGLPEKEWDLPNRLWYSSDHSPICHVKYIPNENHFPLIVETYEQAPEVIEFISNLVEVTGATEVYNHPDKDKAEPYDMALFLEGRLARLFKDTKSDNESARHAAIAQLGVWTSDQTVNLLMPIAKGELRRKKKWYGLRDCDYTPQDKIAAINALREIAEKNEKAKQFLADEMHLTI